MYTAQTAAPSGAAAPNGAVLVFDFGLKHIGVAVAQQSVRIAQALTTLAAQDGSPHWATLDSLVAEWRPTALIVGLPLNMDGTPSAMAQRARDFGSHLATRYALATQYVDERLSTFEAQSRFAQQAEEQLKRTGRRVKQSGRINGDAHIHALAAEVIAETWLRR